ncbi:hypothetical protein [Pseudomonas sp.]|uniref:hypothetical protein n=1 Tax=Pseudomonas sp. TaxID=306 RepID=UPI003D6F4C47
MPTENRSSNTEQMVSVPRDEVERLVKLLQYQAHPYPSPHAEFWQGLLDAPAAQHQGEQVSPYLWVREENDCIEDYTQDPSLAEDWARDEWPITKPLYLHPPTSDGFSAGDMADQGAKAFAARDPEVEELRRALGGMLFAFDDGVGQDWSKSLLDYARKLTPAVEFKPAE